MTQQNEGTDGPASARATPVKSPHDLSRLDLVEIVAHVQGRMYLDLDDSGCEFWNPEKEWSCTDVCMDTQEILNQYGLVPGQEQPYEVAAAGEDDIGRLVDFAEANGLEPEHLDHSVHQCASATASEINNSGVWGQIEYLIDQLGHEGVKSQLAELANKSRATANSD